MRNAKSPGLKMAVIALVVMVYVLAPRSQPTLDETIWETPPRFMIEDPDQDGGPVEREELPPQKESIEDYARSYTATFDEWECLWELWWHESKWDSEAEGPTNDHGIPQANADAHPETSESRWRGDEYEQVRWGVEYIKTRYGGFCEAWDAWTGRATLQADGTWHGGWY